MRSNEDGFASRKFIITGGIILCTTALAVFGKVDTHVALVFAACVGAYNWANLRHHQHDDPE